MKNAVTIKKLSYSPFKPIYWVMAGFISVVLLFAFTSFAQDIPPRPNPPHLVNDLAGMMNAGEQAALEKKLDDYNDSTSTQIVVVTINNLGGNEIAQFGYTLGDKWGVGRKQKDNGVVILVSKEDRKVTIQTGKGMEGAVPDAYCIRIIDNIITPNFRQQQYYQGLDQATDAIIKLAKGEFVNDVKDNQKGIPVLPIIIVVIIILIILSSISRGGRGGSISRGGWMGPMIWGGGGGFGGGFSGGGGGGGFGGFGGGSFGGGGASGSW